MVGSGPHQVESIASQHENSFTHLERRRDQEGSVHTTHTSKSHSRVGSHISQEQHNKAMQREIDHLKRKLCHAQRRQTPSLSDSSSDDEKDSSYRRRSRTPPSESFSYEDEHHGECRCKSPTNRGPKNDAMSKALNQISKFMHRIEGATLPRDFHQPTFTIHNGQTDSVEHESHFSQRMAIHSKDEALMCKVFPFSLGLVAMRWFDGLRADSIDSFKELTRAFGFRFITCTRVPRPLDSLLSLSMQERETLKTYLDRYWEIYNEIDGNFDDVAISTFKSGLPTEHGLRKSLTGKLATNLCQLINWIDKYKRVEEDQ